MIRSMYVTEFNNDVARVAVREKGAKGVARGPDHGLQGRHRHRHLGRPPRAFSQHNKSSPDMVWNSFSDGPSPKRPKNYPPPKLKITE